MFAASRVVAVGNNNYSAARLAIKMEFVFVAIIPLV